MSESTPAAPTLPRSAPSRRRVASSLAWAVPTVVAAAAAPAEAASPPPRIDRLFGVRLASTAVTGTSVQACATGSTRVNVTTDDVNNYYRIANVRTGSTVTNVTASVLVQRSVVDAMESGKNPTTFTWTSTTPSWSAPVREVSGTGSPVLYTNNGTQYYRYYSNLQTAVTPVPAPVSGTITLPRIGWYSNCGTNLTGVMVNGRGSAVVNGMTLNNVGSYIRL